MMDTASPWMGNCKWHTSSFRIIIIWSRDVWKTRERWRRSWGSTHFQFSTSVELTISYCWHNCTVTVLFTQQSPVLLLQISFYIKIMLYCCLSYFWTTLFNCCLRQAPNRMMSTVEEKLVQRNTGCCHRLHSVLRAKEISCVMLCVLCRVNWSALYGNTVAQARVWQQLRFCVIVTGGVRAAAYTSKAEFPHCNCITSNIL